MKERIIASLPGNDTKTSRIGKTKQHALGLQVEVVVLARCLLRRNKAQIAGHTQMQNQPTAAGLAVAAIKEQILATALNGLNAAPGQKLRQAFGHRQPQARKAHHGPLDTPPLQLRLQPAPTHFNLW